MNLDAYKETKEYIQYLEEVKKYYTTKNNYENYKNKFKSKIFKNKELNIQEKKKEFAKLKFKCINCKKEGGTIFNETTDTLHMMCGNIAKPCNLNLKIIKKSYFNLNYEIQNLKNIIYNIKKNILVIKLNLLFNYITEDKAIELFNEQNNEFNKNKEIYYNYLEKYKQITNKPNIDNEIENRQKLINDINEFYKIYKDSKNTNYLNEAHNLYIQELKKLDEEIFKTKYKIHKIEKFIDPDDDIEKNRLILKQFNNNEIIFLNKKN